MEEPLQAGTINEALYYLMVHPCNRCGKGPWKLDHQDHPPRTAGRVSLRVHCGHCGAESVFEFNCRCTVDADGAAAELINPDPSPSRIIDLSQWMGLFYYLIETSASENSRSITRRVGYRAALCLAEALKFYEENELPPGSAFFTDEAKAVFRQKPQNYARQKLRDMQAKLPALPKMARNVDRDDNARGKRWWQFWK